MNDDVKHFYNYEMKIELKDRIGSIKNKSHLIQIFLIITQDNKEFLKNNNGLFIEIHNLKNNTYKKLFNYLNNINDKNLVFK